MHNILIFTDLHGDSYAMHKLEQAYLNNNCEMMICLGDLLYHGPRNDLPSGYKPKEVVEIIKKYKDNFMWIKGNCDAEVDEMVTESSTMIRHDINLFHKDFILVHGHHLHFNHEDNFPEGNIVLYGHFHRYDVKTVDNVTYIGLGSPSIPKDDYAQYAILNEESLTIYDINDNVGPVVLELKKL